MIRKAIVASVGETWIDLLSLDEVERAHDEACGTGASCGSSGCGCRVSGRPFKAAVPGDISVKTGDTVEVSASSSRAVGASLLVLGVPLAAGVAGWFLAGRIQPGVSEALQAAGAAIGLIVGSGLTILLGKQRKGGNLPEITAVVG
jgi:positive regulator of sigma E activity